ncbi:unnamed protein product [Brassica rapa subsp. narinosa]
MFLEDSVLYHIQELTTTSPKLDVKKPKILFVLGV